MVSPILTARRPIIEVLQAAAQRLESAGLFFGHGTDNAHDEAAWLICHALQLPVDKALPDRLLNAREQRQIASLIEQRIELRQPAAYLTGSTWFAGLQFQVSSDVLVPRSPLAELLVNQFQPWIDASGIQTVLDLGTGSGCIAIACAHYLPGTQVTGSDISLPALQLARLNAEANQLAQRCEWVYSDVFQNLSTQRFDLIISNPPYVPELRQQQLPDEYQAEPALGLYSGGDGLEHAARILLGAARQLTSEGHLILELGESADSLQQQLPMIPFIWSEFEYGGEGVLIASRALLQTHERAITHWYQSRNGQEET